MYPIPKAWTLDGFSAGFNKELSATDKKFIKENYR
jgi:serralysin